MTNRGSPAPKTPDRAVLPAAEIPAHFREGKEISGHIRAIAMIVKKDRGPVSANLLVKETSGRTEGETRAAIFREEVRPLFREMKTSAPVHAVTSVRPAEVSANPMETGPSAMRQDVKTEENFPAAESHPSRVTKAGDHPPADSVNRMAIVPSAMKREEKAPAAGSLLFRAPHQGRSHSWKTAKTYSATAKRKRKASRRVTVSFG